jgi:prolipoprotein diacylglyceryltransferase
MTRSWGQTLDRVGDQTSPKEAWSAPLRRSCVVCRRHRAGRAFALYVMLYTAGRMWIESLRIDQANYVGPFRLNVWTSGIVFVLALAFFVFSARLRRCLGRS